MGFRLGEFSFLGRARGLRSVGLGLRVLRLWGCRVHFSAWRVFVYSVFWFVSRFLRAFAARGVQFLDGVSF